MTSNNTQQAQAPPPTASTPVVPRPRITNACEACRSAKVKCQASNQLGICKRCLDSKRECIFKTGPRTRRPRQAKRPDSSTPTNPLPPPAGPSKTFTINIPMALDPDVADSFRELRISHEAFIDNIVPHVTEGDVEYDDDDFDDDGYLYGYDDYHDNDNDLLMTDSRSGVGGGGGVDRSSGAGSVASHTSSLPMGASALSTPPSSSFVSAAFGGSPHRTRDGRGAPGKAPQQRTVEATLGLRPQFNVDSAAALLKTFREVMLSNYPCIVLDEKETVADLAQERPFVLLAVLAAASSSRTLQGHSLYDEEFRKILGLKFVAGGERSLELLQGLAIYIAWFPFHLRPKNKQAFQYIRMAVDLVTDLELDQEDDIDELVGPPPSAQRLSEIRTYLGTYYMTSSASTGWNRPVPMAYSDHTAKCCEVLLRHGNFGDHRLAWKVRLQRLAEETHELRKIRKGHPQSEYQIGLILKGVESQLNEWEAIMPADVAASPSIRMSVLFTRIFITGAPLLKLPSTKLPHLDTSTFKPDPQRLESTIPTLHEFYEFVLQLSPAEINGFAGVDWGTFILTVILGYRMSFPLLSCPEWDDREARRRVRFGEYVDRMCVMAGDDADDIRARLTPASSQRSMDVLSASKVVLDAVRKKFHRRVARLEQALDPAPAPAPAPLPTQREERTKTQWAAAAAHHPGLDLSRLQALQQIDHGPGCPMLDGSMDQYYPYWDETFATNHLGVPAAAAAGATGAGVGIGIGTGTGVDLSGSGLAEAPPPQQQQQFISNDLWATMTMGWTQDDINFEGM